MHFSWTFFNASYMHISQNLWHQIGLIFNSIFPQTQKYPHIIAIPIPEAAKVTQSLDHAPQILQGRVSRDKIQTHHQLAATLLDLLTLGWWGKENSNVGLGGGRLHRSSWLMSSSPQEPQWVHLPMPVIKLMWTLTPFMHRSKGNLSTCEFLKLKNTSSRRIKFLLGNPRANAICKTTTTTLLLQSDLWVHSTLFRKNS